MVARWGNSYLGVALGVVDSGKGEAAGVSSMSKRGDSNLHEGAIRAS